MKRYEQSIRAITAFFAVLLGFGLKRLLDAEAFDPPNARWPCFLMSVFLFLRFLLGSNNHMWVEFVYPDRDEKNVREANSGRVLNDFLFLVVFGLIGMAICYSATLYAFLIRNLVLTGLGFFWVVGYALIGKGKGKWIYWGWVNSAQFLLVLICLRPLGRFPWWPSFFPDAAWDWSLVILVLGYVGIFVWDFLMQLKLLRKATNLTLDEMKRFVKDHFENFVNNRKAEVIRNNMTSDFYDHDGPDGKPTGVEGDEQMMKGMYKLMPDLRMTIEDMVAEGDKVVCRNIWRWTDASGEKMQFHGFVLWRFERGKIAERWATLTPPAEGTAWTPT